MKRSGRKITGRRRLKGEVVGIVGPLAVPKEGGVGADVPGDHLALPVVPVDLGVRSEGGSWHA